MGSITLDDFFTGEPDRCERLIAALQFCTELRSVDEETMSMDSLSSVRVYIIPADDRFDSQHPMISVSSLQNSSVFLAAPRKGSIVSTNDRFIKFTLGGPDSSSVQQVFRVWREVSINLYSVIHSQYSQNRDAPITFILHICISIVFV